MYKYVITHTDFGRDIYVDLISSLAGHYLSRRPYIINVIKEAATPLNLRGKRVIIEQDMGRNIGNTDIIKTTEKDIIYYAQPVKKDVFSRFAKNRYPHPSKTLTVIFEQDADGNYEVSDTWIGPSSPAFPGDEHETSDSKVYWQTHALVQDAQAIKSNSITKECPY